MMIPIDEDIKGLIFDCDGTLVDSMPAHWQAWQETFQEYDLDCPVSWLEQHAGVPIKETLLKYLEEFSIEKYIDTDEFVAKKHARSLEKLRFVKAVQPVVDIVLKYHSVLPMCVASGGNRQNVLTSLEAIQIARYFDIVITSDDPVAGKPNPDIFLYAAYRMKVKPQYCLVFEDGEMGITAAREAGMKVFDVRTLTTQPE
ncbi:MAG: HAD family phosphatase [Candidatus Marinimicrobia bacterium]|nr:HAD family phosphatase [Candidatus Neomarinimicrobiota bacterium]